MSFNLLNFSGFSEKLRNTQWASKNEFIDSRFSLEIDFSSLSKKFWISGPARQYKAFGSGRAIDLSEATAAAKGYRGF